MLRSILGLTLVCLISSHARAVIVSGHVTDANTGTAIANASVGAFEGPFGPPFFLTTFTDIAGFYAFDAPAGFLQMNVSAAGYIAQETSQNLGSAPLTVDFMLETAGAVSGTLTDAGTHDALAGFSLTLSNSPTNSFSATTNENGEFDFANIPPGDYSLCLIDFYDDYRNICYNQKLIGADGAVTFTPVHVASGATTTGKNIAAPKGATISGHLTDRYFGGPIANPSYMEIQLYTPSQQQVVDFAPYVDADGGYTIGGIAPGSYFMSVGRPFTLTTNTNYDYTLYGNFDCGLSLGGSNCPFGQATPLKVPATGLTGVDFALFPGYIVKGKVVDDTTGAGIPGVTVYTCDVGFLVAYSGSAVTDTNGNYVVGHVQGSSTTITTLDAPAHINERWPNTPVIGETCEVSPDPATVLHFTAPDQVLTGIDFHLSDGSLISGNVDNPRYGPASAKVALIATDAGQQTLVASVQTDVDGAYSFSGQLFGAYYVVAYLADGSDCTIYPSTPCGNWNHSDPLTVDFSAAGDPLLLGHGSTYGLDLMTLDASVFTNGFE